MSCFVLRGGPNRPLPPWIAFSRPCLASGWVSPMSNQPLLKQVQQKEKHGIILKINHAKIEFNFFFSRAPPILFLIIWWGINIRVGSRTGIPSGECHTSNERFNGSFNMVKQRAQYLKQLILSSLFPFVWICRARCDPFISRFHVSIWHQPPVFFVCFFPVDNFQKFSAQLG